MNEFKLNKKKIFSDKRSTFEEKHTRHINILDAKKKNLIAYKKELDDLVKIKQINKTCNNNILVRINYLKNEIYDIEHEKSITDYLFNSLEFIEKFEDLEEVNKNDNENTRENDTVTYNNKMIYTTI